MLNIKLTISYDGSFYYGSQIQPNHLTIHNILNEIFKKLNIKTTLNFSGRTDKGVHAFKQVVSCFIPNYWINLNKLKNTINKMLPNDIYVRSIYKVEDNFHARFSAKTREYRYLISTKPLTPFNSKYLAYYKNIDHDKIIEASNILIGTHNFKYFSKTGSDPHSTIRTILNIKLYNYKNIYIIKFTANSYLRSQIRMMVDFLMKISNDKLSTKDLKLQLSCKKNISTTLAPPSGLYLSKITY